MLLTGAVLHDIGKVAELTYDRSFGYSTEGQLLGHIVIGLRMLHEKLQQVPDFPPKLRVLVEHLIVSHHGELEYGSPKVPLFPEAMLLHHLDNLDSKMECMRALAEKDRRIEGSWTGYSPSLERSILKKAKYLEDASAAVVEIAAAPVTAAPVEPAPPPLTQQPPEPQHAHREHQPPGHPTHRSPRNCSKHGARILDASAKPAKATRFGRFWPAYSSPGYFLFFTWRGLLVYFTGDDLMNLYGYLSKPVSALVKAQLSSFGRPITGPLEASFIEACSRFSASIRTPSTWCSSRRCW